MNESPKRRRRPILLTVVLVLLFLGGAKAIYTLLFRIEQFREAFTGSTPALEVVAGLLTAWLLVGAVALLAWQRWAFVFSMSGGVATLVLDLVVRAPWLHTASGAFLLVLLSVAVWPIRRHFAPWYSGPAAP